MNFGYSFPYLVDQRGRRTPPVKTSGDRGGDVMGARHRLRPQGTSQGSSYMAAEAYDHDPYPFIANP